jgi:hypothetical protein
MLGIVYTKIKSDKCFKCGLPTIRDWVFCGNCIPSYSDVVNLPYPNHSKVIFVGSIGLYNICMDRIEWNIDSEVKAHIGHVEVIKWWMGTDAFTLHEMPPGLNKLRIKLHRIKYRILNHTIDWHWAVSEMVADNLVKFGIPEEKIRIVEHPPQHQSKLDPEVFVVGYYLPEKDGQQDYKDWVYGKDIIEELIKIYKDTSITFFRYTGKESLSFLNVIDCFIRPSRSDGMPRILLKCGIEKIPCEMSVDGNPKAYNFQEFIEGVIEHNRRQGVRNSN